MPPLTVLALEFGLKVTRMIALPEIVKSLMVCSHFNTIPTLNRHTDGQSGGQISYINIMHQYADVR